MRSFDSSFICLFVGVGGVFHGVAKSDRRFRHACPCVWNTSAPGGRIFVKFHSGHLTKICQESSSLV
jgi:hypothetical protein